MAVAGNFIKIGILNSLNPYIQNTPANISEYIEALKVGNYPIILAGPYVTSFETFLIKIGIIPYYCKVELPFLREGESKMENNFKFIYFLDQEKCLSFIEAAHSYYTAEFDSLCARGEEFIQIINTAMTTDNAPLTKSCSNKSKLYLLNNPLKIQSLFLCVILITYISMQLGKTVKNKRAPTNNIKRDDKENVATPKRD